MLDVDSSTKSSDVLRHIVAEDDRSHGRLACTGTPHEQDLALLLALATLRRAHDEELSPECVRVFVEMCIIVMYSRRSLIARHVSSTGAEARANSLALAVTTGLGVDFSRYTSSTGADISTF